MQPLKEHSIEKTISALIDREHARVNRFTTNFFEDTNVPKDVVKAIEFLKEFVFDTLFPTYGQDLIKDAVEKDKIDSRYKRFAGFVKYIAPSLVLDSDLVNELGGHLRFIRTGLEIGTRDGKPHRVSLDSVLREGINISENVSSFLDREVKYIRGFAEAYENQRFPGKNPQVLPIEDLVEDRGAIMYALLKTFTKGRVSKEKALRKKYDLYSTRFTTNGQEGEYSHILQQPFDLILQMGRFFCEVVGSPESWMGIIEYATTHQKERSKILQVFRKTGIPEEARTFLDEHKDVMYQKLVEVVSYSKQIINLAARDLRRTHISVMEEFGRKEKQRKVLRAYGPLVGDFDGKYE